MDALITNIKKIISTIEKNIGQDIFIRPNLLNFISLVKVFLALIKFTLHLEN